MRPLCFSPTKAFSLLELVLALGLSFLVLSATTLILIEGFRFYRRNEAILDLQQSALTSLARLARELSESNQEGVSVQPAALLFATPRGRDGSLRIESTGRFRWSQVVAYWLDATTATLRRGQLELGNPGVDVPDLKRLGWTSVNFSPGQTVARSALEFEVMLEQSSLAVRLQLGSRVAPLYQVTMTTRVTPRH